MLWFGLTSDLIHEEHNNKPQLIIICRAHVFKNIQHKKLQKGAPSLFWDDEPNRCVELRFYLQSGWHLVSDWLLCLSSRPNDFPLRVHHNLKGTQKHTVRTQVVMLLHAGLTVTGWLNDSINTASVHSYLKRQEAWMLARYTVFLSAARLWQASYLSPN